MTSHRKENHKDKLKLINKIICYLCGKSFCNNYWLKHHVKIIHEKRKDYKCEKCEKLFSDKNNLKAHVKMVHENIKDKICDVCGKAFGNTTMLKVHKDAVHEGLKVQCPNCHKYLSKSGLKEHIDTVHIKSKRYNCQFCEKSYGGQTHLRRHLRTIHMDLLNSQK